MSLLTGMWWAQPVRPGCVRRLQVLLRPLGMLVLIGACGVAGAQQFSAEVIERGPQGRISQGRIHVSGDLLREQDVASPVSFIRIQNRAQGVQWVLSPQQQTYIEVKAAPGTAAGNDACRQPPNPACIDEGPARVDGRPVRIWRMLAEGGGERPETREWIDTERGIVLRRETSNGQRMQWRRLALDLLDGRYAERWEVIIDGPSGLPARSFIWIDSELAIPVREEREGGLVRELRNIRVDRQLSELFEVPVGYKRVESLDGDT